MTKWMVVLTGISVALLCAGQVYAAPPAAPSVGQHGNGQGILARLRNADTNGDGKISYEEAHAALPRLTPERFSRLDTDGDGFTSIAELRQLIQAKFQEADANHDGKVTLDEARTVFPKMTPERFNKLDRNGDGVLSSEDRQQGPGEGGQGRLVRMRAADANGDGKVAFEEAQKAFPRITRERFAQLDRNGDGVLTEEDRPAKR